MVEFDSKGKKAPKGKLFIQVEGVEEVASRTVPTLVVKNEISTL